MSVTSPFTSTVLQQTSISTVTKPVYVLELVRKLAQYFKLLCPQSPIHHQYALHKHSDCYEKKAKTRSPSPSGRPYFGKIMYSSQWEETIKF